MTYFVARAVHVTHVNPYGWKPAQGRMLHATKQEAVADLYRLTCESGTPGPVLKVMDADHEPGRSILNTQCGP